MVRSCVLRRGSTREPAVALYLPMVREYVPYFDEKAVKEAVKLAGGEINQSGLFLASTSNALTVSSATGINRRSVMYVLCAKLTTGVLKRLDRLCNHTSELENHDDERTIETTEKRVECSSSDDDDTLYDEFVFLMPRKKHRMNQIHRKISKTKFKFLSTRPSQLPFVRWKWTVGIYAVGNRASSAHTEGRQCIGYTVNNATSAWFHSYYKHVTPQELKLVRRYVCHACKD